MADQRVERIAEFIKPLRVKPGSKLNLGKDFDPGYKADYLKKKDGVELLKTGIAMLADYQARLAAQDTHGVLVCLQALDAGGKDGTIRHVMSGGIFNTAGNNKDRRGRSRTKDKTAKVSPKAKGTRA